MEQGCYAMLVGARRLAWIETENRKRESLPVMSSTNRTEISWQRYDVLVQASERAWIAKTD